jgi:rare lipoprotein A
MADSPAATATAAPSNAAAQGHATTHAADGAAPTVGVHVGKVSYYGSRFAGRKTASGELFDPSALTMAHRTLPFGTRVRVTNLHTGHSVVVRVNDHGPNHAGRIGDLSHAAAAQLRMLHSGVVRARLEVLGSAQAKTARKGTRQAR